GPATPPTENLASLLPNHRRDVAPPASRDRLPTPRRGGPSRSSRTRWAVFLLTAVLTAAAGVGLVVLVEWLGQGGPGPHPAQVPLGFKAGSEEVATDFAGRKFYRKLVVDRPGRPPVPFVLIEQKTADDVPTFYVMESKTSYEEFARFAAA